MTDTSVERKLTTVLCADVAGYTRLMDADEVATLTLLSEYRDTFTGFIARHRGHVVNTAGDSVLAEFPSVVEAVQCALEVQRELGARNDDLPDDRRMDFRIGVNLGDVMVQNGDLFGEGVNIANRLQQIAAPGGICVSGSVHDQVRNKLTVGFEFLGPRAIKNIAEEVPVYRLETGLERGAPEAGGDPPPAPATTEAGPVVDGAIDDQVRKEVARLKKFYRHAIWYGVVVGGLFILNMVTSAGYWWWLWVAFGMGIPLAVHALRAYDVSGMILGHDWEERKTREVQERMKRGN